MPCPYTYLEIHQPKMGPNKIISMGPNMGQQLKMGLKLKMKHQHACAQIRQLQIFGLVGRHLGAKPKMKLKMNPNTTPMMSAMSIFQKWG